MAVSASNPRPIIVYESIADHWAITSFTVRTPQNGDDNSLEVTAEAFLGVPGPNRSAVTTLKTVTFTPAQIVPLLTMAGGIYDAARAQNVSRSDAMYLALKRALEQAQQAAGIFPTDAT